MLHLLKSLFGPSSRLLLLLLVLTSTVSCSSLGPLSLLTGGGPKVAANTQIGKENNQGINTTIDNSVRPVARPSAPVDTIDQSNNTTNNTEIDPLLLFLLIIGWLAPSPSEIGRSILGLFKRKKE